MAAVSLDKQILVVDDDEQILLVWRGALSKPGWAVETAASGDEALAMVRQMAYDLVVTDIRMPQMNGFELTQAIRALRQIYAGYLDDLFFMPGYGNTGCLFRRLFLLAQTSLYQSDPKGGLRGSW